MPVVKIPVILLAAVRICLYMRCFRTCIGEYRVSRKIVTAVFAALWIFEGFILSISSIGREIEVTDFFFFLVELPFLLVMSFCYRGRIVRCLLMGIILPVVYWFGKWSIMHVLFSNITSEYQYFILTAISVSLLFAFEMLLERAGKSRQERERERLEQEIRIYENQFGIIRQSQHNIRALKHDMKHHIKMLTDMVSGGENEAALEYLASMGTFMENTEEYVATGNEKIDSILNYMIARAKSARVDVSWKIQIPEHLEIPVFDINVILSNLFENAMNALTDVKEPSLSIMMKYDRGILCISTRNTCSGSRRMTGAPDCSGKERLTGSFDCSGKERLAGSTDCSGKERLTRSTDCSGKEQLTGFSDCSGKERLTGASDCSGKERIPEDSGEHGFGLKNIQRITEKYHGSLTTAIREGDFHASVLLFLEDAEGSF